MKLGEKNVMHFTRKRLNQRPEQRSHDILALDGQITFLYVGLVIFDWFFDDNNFTNQLIWMIISVEMV